MSSLIGALCTVVLALVGVLAGSGPDAAAGITTTYDGAAYTYDASFSSSTQDVAAPSPRGSPATLPAASWEDSVPLGRFGDAANTGTVGQLTAGGRATASQLDEFGAAQGWARSQTATGPVKYTDGNGVVRLTIKQGSPRAPGSGGPHVELRNPDGIRIDPFGNPVSRTSPGNHTPIVWDW